jgi:hypothetical protein
MKEDYVSFEVAKLLKEKGFDEKIPSVWIDHGMILVSNRYKPSIHVYPIDSCENWNKEDDFYTSAPTHQMAMKWLREVHKIIITMDFDEYELEIKGKKVGYGYNLQLKSNPREYAKVSEIIYDTYEESCEAAIQYCLTNLI